ncbi:MAG: GAF domain-containing protein, partial [Coleofasciculaceae cyanobacterium RL_1_1]|nr:GAF domain-containing protein [Coleofasciculaceae cyanobacterium RL_1_1]
MRWNTGTGERLWGLLIAHQCDRPRRWQNREIQLLSQLSGQIAIAL